jgi:phospholipase/carboxylesterase
VLPIDACSRRLVPLLRETGYEVAYEEFDGGHTVPPAVADRAFAWWLGSDGRPGGDGAGGAILGP